ncbi:DUF305 domain-containing protein [Pseudonocardia sp. KRD-184]|uniref:DUF305 domain-containing protein n=1 Tax=Pseudonocardia oceani TaxID=2792013 RepID=A0ABS6UIU9_9PSEU|nr:DUF305 domain-containing protein [Pseudonocardia oceani]MBW0092846.1 DUF305 domain-containing protein [Pseudonocardia oceani]MBW0099647.1 DUF305 domain-containing protein [Pseudonocardia oceani]MBW0109526.1 DUF305 domain-containing protein [Pseudonocardia oceani]MBW0121558.1 DUF305 domain-containing protein [Pseudonocardia oceani]MBW0132184.1 DUF305 domain-containing protein [Pseudonocardia oceani]
MRRPVVLAALVAALAGCGAAEPGLRTVVPGAPGEPARVMGGAEAAQRRAPVPVSPADVEFVAAMIPHHEQALAVAALAPGRAADSGVRAMAERIAGVQGPEVAVLRAWLARHGSGHPGHPAHAAVPGMVAAERLAELAAASGPAFDRLFVATMIAHHEGALAMAAQVRASGTDLFVAGFADDVVATQTADIDRLRGLPLVGLTQ